MRLISLSLFCFSLASCSSINVERKSELAFDRLFVAKIEGRESITLEPNESKAGRVLVGLVSAGPVGAIATANTENGFSEPKAFKYTLRNPLQESSVIISRSVVDIGSCVEVISPGESDLEVLILVPKEHCETSYNKAMHPTSG